MKLPYAEGTWFAVPLRTVGYAVGVVARTTKKGRVILCYFFGPSRENVPQLHDVQKLRPQDALRVLRIGDLHLINGKWPIIGQSHHWQRTEWPMPVFIRREILPPYRNWLVHYSDSDPNNVIQEEREINDRPELEEDSLFGAGALEIVMSKLLKVEI
jgi:hypothetical protein